MSWKAQNTDKIFFSKQLINGTVSFRLEMNKVPKFQNGTMVKVLRDIPEK